MLDMSWGEVMLIGGVALIVIGPKDLPKALRTVGQVTTKLRRMAGEFQMQFNEAIREAELDEVRKDVDGLRNTARSMSGFNPVQTIRDELKGAVEGRAKTAETSNPEPQQAGMMGPERPAPEARTLADATAQLKAERGADQAEAAPRPDTGPEAAPPVPGSVNDPYGMPAEPPAAGDDTTKSGTAGR